MSLNGDKSLVILVWGGQVCLRAKRNRDASAGSEHQHGRAFLSAEFS